MDPYRKNVDILRKNRENVPLAELKTKYANGYLQICEKIKEQTKSAISALITDGMIILTADQAEELPKIVSEIQKIIDQETAAGTMKEISRLIFSKFDVDQAMDLAAEKLARPAFEKAYGPYFRKKMQTAGGQICLRPAAWNDMERRKRSLDGCRRNEFYANAAADPARRKGEREWQSRKS